MVRGQLTFDVKPLAVPGKKDVEIVGTLRIRGALSVDLNLDHGDMLLVAITGPDGEVIATCEAKIAAPPSFIPIEDKDLGLVGYERAHVAKLT